MKQRKYVVFAMVIVMLAVIALSVNTVLAGNFDRSTPFPEEHPPVCHTYGYILECTDAGEDIVNVSVKTVTKYDLDWDSAHVYLRIYPQNFNDVAYWVVEDKAGSVVSGRLP